MANEKLKHKIKTISKKITKRRRVTFSFEAAAAKRVILMGDFNDWDPKKHVMKNDGKGLWSKTVVLAPGKYEYKFFVDGQWQNDPNNDQMVANSFGTLNNILTV